MLSSCRSMQTSLRSRCPPRAVREPLPSYQALSWFRAQQLSQVLRWSPVPPWFPAARSALPSSSAPTVLRWLPVVPSVPRSLPAAPSVLPSSPALPWSAVPSASAGSPSASGLQSFRAALPWSAPAPSPARGSSRRCRSGSPRSISYGPSGTGRYPYRKRRSLRPSAGRCGKPSGKYPYGATHPAGSRPDSTDDATGSDRSVR